MIQVFCIEDDYLRQVDVQPGRPLPAGALWIDLLNPTAEEDKSVEAWAGTEIPTSEDMGEIEESSRFYMEGGAQYLTVPMLYAPDKDHRSIAPVSFVLTDKLIVTVRYAEPKAIAHFISRVTKAGNGLISPGCGGTTVMIGILEAATDRLADILEGVAADNDKASNNIFHRPPNARPMSTKEFRHILTRIGAQGAFLSKVRESLSGIRRLVAYVTVTIDAKSSKDAYARIKALDRDAQSLENYVDFLSNKITFLLDTIVGLITVEQSAITKIFSIVAVIFMPPTLIASIYGMNFHFMPELDDRWGYPLSLALMVLSAAVPLYYFRKKGWL